MIVDGGRSSVEMGLLHKSRSDPNDPDDSDDDLKAADPLIPRNNPDDSYEDHEDGFGSPRIADGDDDTRAFLSHGLAEHHAPIAQYEGRHRYDPSFRWKESEEAAVVRKVRMPAGLKLQELTESRSTSKSVPGSASCSSRCN